jgi:hypothetical protein
MENGNIKARQLVLDKPPTSLPPIEQENDSPNRSTGIGLFAFSVRIASHPTATLFIASRGPAGDESPPGPRGCHTVSSIALARAKARLLPWKPGFSMHPAVLQKPGFEEKAGLPGRITSVRPCRPTLRFLS